MKTCVELWIPKHIYDLVIEECNIQWLSVSYISTYQFLNSFSWACSRQWWHAWSNYSWIEGVGLDFRLVEKWMKDNWWNNKNDNDFYINMMKD